jgi:hypothetical protein
MTSDFDPPKDGSDDEDSRIPALYTQEPVKIPVNQDVTITTPRLGPVGGRIVAEVFIGLLAGDANSLLSLDLTWRAKSGPNYALKDFVNYALGN